MKLKGLACGMSWILTGSDVLRNTASADLRKKDGSSSIGPLICGATHRPFLPGYCGGTSGDAPR